MVKTTPVAPVCKAPKDTDDKNSLHPSADIIAEPVFSTAVIWKAIYALPVFKGGHPPMLNNYCPSFQSWVNPLSLM